MSVKATRWHFGSFLPVMSSVGDNRGMEKNRKWNNALTRGKQHRQNTAGCDKG